MIFFLIIRRTPRSTRTDTLFPYTTLFRSPETVPRLRRTGGADLRRGLIGFRPLRRLFMPNQGPASRPADRQCDRRICAVVVRPGQRSGRARGGGGSLHSKACVAVSVRFSLLPSLPGLASPVRYERPSGWKEF